MTENATVELKDAVNISDNGGGVYLLFVASETERGHDIVVTDFVRSFRNPTFLMEYYDRAYKEYGTPPALIAKFDGYMLTVRYRYDALLDADGWSEAWDD